MNSSASEALVKYVNPIIPTATHYSIANLERAEKLKYAFSYDKFNPVTNKIVKNFFSLAHFSDVEKLLAEDKHIYEIAYNKTRKLYFDFDNVSYSKTEATHFINTFVGYIEDELQITINSASIIVLKNDKDKRGHPTDIINSLHIIISDYKIDANELWDLAKFINHTYDMSIDVNVYKKNQQFRLWKQSKMAKKNRLVNFYDTAIFPLRKSLINITEKCKLVTFNKSINIADYYSKLDDGKKSIQLPKEKIFELILNGKVQAKQPQTSYEKLADGIMHNDQITFDRDAFFDDKNANDWKTITMLLIKYPYLHSIEHWNKESVRLANNPTYSYNANVEYCKKIVAEEVKSGYTKLYKLISSYCLFHNIYDAMDYMKNYVRDYLARFYDMETIREIAGNIVKFKTNEKISRSERMLSKTKFTYKTLTNNDSIIDIKTGFIYIENEDKTITNMYNDNLPKKHENMFHDISHIDEAVEEAKLFLTNQKKMFILKSRWGTGKTHKIIRLFLKDFKLADGKQPRILIITESTGLNNKLTEDFKQYNFVSHLQAQRDVTFNLKNPKNIICSIQSIGKVGNHYDLIIIDEYESVCSSYSASTTFKGTTPNIAFNTLIQLIKSSEKTLICDADISEDKVQLIERVVGRNEMMIFKNNQTAFAGMNINILTNKQHFTTLLITSVFVENKKIAVASATRVFVEAVFDDIIKLYETDAETPIKKLMRVDVNGVKVFHGTTEIKIEKSKDDILRDVEAFIIEHQIDLFLYSPTIKTGLSINSAYFHQTFGYTSSYSILFNEMIQMLYRNRQVQDNKIILFIDERDFKSGVNKPLSFIKDHQHIKTSLYKHLIATKQSELDSVRIYAPSECSEEYYELQAINNRNKWNSRYNYVYNLIQLLQYHGLKYTYITNKTYEIVKSEYDIDIDDAIKTLKDKKRCEWLATELLDYEDYEERKTRPNHTKYHTKNDHLPVYNQAIKNSYDKSYVIFTLFRVHYLVADYQDDIIERSPYNPFNNITTNEQINNNIQNHIRGYNNDDFYEKYIADGKQRNVKEIYRLFHSTTAETDGLMHNENDTMILNKLTAERIVAMFGIYDNETKIFTPRTITNKEFAEILKSNIPAITLIYNIAVHKDSTTFNATNKQHLKAVYHYIKQLFQIIDVCVEYVDAGNTTRHYDKMIFYNAKTFYKYKSLPFCSTTLNSLTDYSKPQTLTIKKTDVYDASKISKMLNRAKNSKPEYQKLQKSLLYYENDGVDCERVASVITQPMKWEKSYDDNERVNPVNYAVKNATDTRLITINETFYNPLLNMKTIDEQSVMINDKQYPIHNKKNDQHYIVMNNRPRQTEPVYKTDKGDYRPYSATIPTIKTETADNDYTPASAYYTEKKNTYEDTGEECCECDMEDGDIIKYLHINAPLMLQITSPIISVI